MKIFISKSVLGILAITLVATLGLVGCGGTTETKNTTSTENKTTTSSGKISIIGSTSVQPLAEALQSEFNKKNPNTKIDIQGVGSTAGIKAVNDGTADIGTSSRDLTPEEKAWNLKETIIASDGIAIVLNPKNQVTNLTKEQVTKIFKGEIKNWKEIGGVDKEILVVSREAGAGTRGAFEELMKIEKKENGKLVSLLIANALIAEGNGSVKANVGSKENSIGYMSLGMIDNTVKAVKVDGVDITVENIKNKKYPVARPFIMLTKGDQKPDTKAFLDYILSSEGQNVVSKDYISVK